MAQPKRVILCVDDEENSLILRKLVLEKSGYAVMTAGSATQAMEILGSQPVDLVLSDQLMPDETGTELARRIKASRPGLPVVLVSGVNEVPADANSADLFISKLEGPENLCRKIAEVLTAGFAASGEGS
ncbi:MAG: response regulator [Candidatus Korobacteraceae bacterium]